MPGDDIDRSPLHLLHRAGQCTEAIFAAAMLPGLTPRQLAVLMTVAEREGLSQTELGDHTGIDRSTTADIVRRLMRKGLLQRRRSRSDARAQMLKLTDEGRKDLAQALPRVERVNARVLDVLPGPRREEFLKALARIVGAAEATAARSQPRSERRSGPERALQRA